MIVFAGEYIFPEPDPKWRFERAASSNFVYPGRLYDWDNTPLYLLKYGTYGPSHHMTNVFNIFVFLQIFNMINCRKINDEKNIFDGIFDNKMFSIVWVIIVIVQVLLIEFCSIAFDVSYGGLPWQHWVIAFVLGLFSLVWEFILKLIPDKICPEFGSKQKDPMQDEDHNVLSIRKKRSQSF